MNFDEIFKSTYEETYVKKIFNTHECRVYKEDFITSIAGDFDDSGKLEWIFNPSDIRKHFLDQVWKHFPDDEISMSSQN